MLLLLLLTWTPAGVKPVDGGNSYANLICPLTPVPAAAAAAHLYPSWCEACEWRQPTQEETAEGWQGLRTC